MEPLEESSHPGLGREIVAALAATALWTGVLVALTFAVVRFDGGPEAWADASGPFAFERLSSAPPLTIGQLGWFPEGLADARCLEAGKALALSFLGGLACLPLWLVRRLVARDEVSTGRDLGAAVAGGALSVALFLAFDQMVEGRSPLGWSRVAFSPDWRLAPTALVLLGPPFLALVSSFTPRSSRVRQAAISAGLAAGLLVAVHMIAFTHAGPRWVVFTLAASVLLPLGAAAVDRRLAPSA